MSGPATVAPMLARLLLIVAGLAGCAGSPERARETAFAIAGEGALVPVEIAAPPFLLQGFRRAAASETLVVYLEGDGNAWVRRNQISTDPSPQNPVALRLAAADPAPAVLYLARPCQYQGGRDLAGAPPCDNRWWTSHRFAPEVVAATGAAIDGEMRRGGHRRVVLVGYSGGGVLAALIAAQRQDVDRLVTVAAPLALTRWTQLHDVTPLSASIDPLMRAGAIGMEQVHFVGGRDTVVPRAIVTTFVAGVTAGTPVRLVEEPTFDHACCWAEAWLRLLSAQRTPP